MFAYYLFITFIFVYLCEIDKVSSLYEHGWNCSFLMNSYIWANKWRYHESTQDVTHKPHHACSHRLPKQTLFLSNLSQKEIFIHLK